LIPVLYLAPWVDVGGSDTSTIDWFRFLDHDRFRPSLITTQPSPNRRLRDVAPYAEELWELPRLLPGDDFPRFILSFIHTRGVRVVHIMNSGLGFELLPDIAGLPDPPRVVVQFHGEEPGGTGYVRYATTRFGNLIDAFSITTGLLHPRLDAYGVPPSKRRLIFIGVDAENEFCPDRVEAVDLDPSAFQLLFVARLTGQKDPLLMVEVAARLRDSGLRFQIQVLGDGELTAAVRALIAARDLQHEVLLRGPHSDLAPWYAGCDAVLLTSHYETSPTRAAHEAMAMGVPIVAPNLPEFRELVVAGTGVLVPERENPGAYAQAIREIAEDEPARTAMGAAGRARVREQFSAVRMAAEHGALYEELLEGVPDLAAEPPPPPLPRSPRFGDRRRGTTPLVSVIVPCFNQGHYLRACLESVANQTYPSIETVVVDDGSTDPDTVATIAELEGGALVVRLPSNHGPSAARNAGIERSSGRYVLPLDADDLLLPAAVAELVDQIGDAALDTGFIYPNLQFFGNRDDYLEMPSYNLSVLLHSNYCAVSSLIDREVFDRGFRFPDDLVLGHEDWDFVLTLAEHGIYGEPARTKTLLCRRQGFTRNDLVEANIPFSEDVAARHPALYSRRAALKAQWNPALTVIALDAAPGRGDERLAAARAGQTCGDFELLAPREPADSRAVALARGIRVARGRYVLAAYGSPAELLADPTSVEKTLRILLSCPGLAALALADAGASEPAFALLDGAAIRVALLGALCWPTTGPAAPPADLPLGAERPLEALARMIAAEAPVQWRQGPLGRASVGATPDDRPGALLGAPRRARARDVHFTTVAPALPECPPGVPHRLVSLIHWRPPQTRLLCRHRHHTSGDYTYTNWTAPPDGYVLERVLGCVREYPLAGTIALRLTEDERPFVLGEHGALDDPLLLGFLDRNPLPLFDPLRSGRDPRTGRQVLLAGEEDPLADGLVDPTVLGFITPHPLRPLRPPHTDVLYGLSGLVRTVDLEARRHRYAAGATPVGVPAGELGALFSEPTGDCDPLWIDREGRVFAAARVLFNGRRSLSAATRWTGAPLRWKGFGQPGAKLRASARRAYESARLLATPPARPDRPAQPAGYLLRSPTSRTLPLYAAIHPVTGDQLLSTDRLEATTLGYDEPGLLGHLIARAPVTGRLGPIRRAAPWASRFGMVGAER
jgi:glycosyltransferase involved in cell wall biosynthesis